MKPVEQKKLHVGPLASTHAKSRLPAHSTRQKFSDRDSDQVDLASFLSESSKLRKGWDCPPELARQLEKLKNQLKSTGCLAILKVG